MAIFKTSTTKTKVLLDEFLLGGGFNQFETYSSKCESSPSECEDKPGGKPTPIVDERNPAPLGILQNPANSGINYQPQLVIKISSRFLPSTAP